MTNEKFLVIAKCVNDAVKEEAELMDIKKISFIIEGEDKRTGITKTVKRTWDKYFI